MAGRAQRGKAVAHTCAQCEEVYWAPERGQTKASPPPSVCGRSECWARQYATPEEWAGRKRMAEALIGAMLEGDPARTYVDPTTSLTRYLLPHWSPTDEEAMRRG